MISHFSRFLVISSFFESSSGCFSFSMIFCFLPYSTSYTGHFQIFHLFQFFLAIFHVLKSVFLVFCDCQVFRHIPDPSVCISHFSRILVISSFFKSSKWMFLIFHDFQLSCHIPSPTVDISKFSTFFSFPRHISRPKVCISHFP